MAYLRRVGFASWLAHARLLRWRSPHRDRAAGKLRGISPSLAGGRVGLSDIPFGSKNKGGALRKTWVNATLRSGSQLLTMGSACTRDLDSCKFETRTEAATNRELLSCPSL